MNRGGSCQPNIKVMSPACALLEWCFRRGSHRGLQEKPCLSLRGTIGSWVGSTVELLGRSPCPKTYQVGESPSKKWTLLYLLWVGTNCKVARTSSVDFSFHKSISRWAPPMEICSCPLCKGPQDLSRLKQISQGHKPSPRARPVPSDLLLCGWARGRHGWRVRSPGSHCTLVFLYFSSKINK